MRTRKANRTKRYDFGSPEPAPDDAAANADDVFQDSPQDASSPSAASDSDTHTPLPQITPRRRAKPKPKKPTSGYLNVEPVATDLAIRGYAGPYDRSMRGKPLINAWYGRSERAMQLTQAILDQWYTWTVLPPRYPPFPHSPWAEMPDTSAWKEKMHAHAEPTRYAVVTDPADYRMPNLEMPLLTGLYNAPQQVAFAPGTSYTLSHGWTPAQETEEPTGWLFDVGGIVTGLDWARRQGTQVLALAVIPHADQEPAHDYEAEHQDPNYRRFGTVQIWEMGGEPKKSVMVPTKAPAVLQRTICLDNGRVTRVKWSPEHEHLAMLCSDRVCIVEVATQMDKGAFDWVEHSLATFAFGEASVKPTAMTWANANRLVVGYSDGSIALWSVYPECMLSRHAVHHSMVVDIAAAYPSHGYLVASTPLGGSTRLVDLRNPSSETTEIQTKAVIWQPNMLSWNEHIQGFFSMYPSANALNTMIGFMHYEHFPIIRRVFTGESFNSCLSSGYTHPFVLVGSTDGSLWAFNPQTELFKPRREQTDKLRLFQHEHRPKEAYKPGEVGAARGVTRITHGFAIEKAKAPKNDSTKIQGKKTKRPNKADEGDDDEETVELTDPTRVIVYEPLSRITAVEWNPNPGFGCWAAAAMASGLVRVIDLSLDNEPSKG